MHRPVALLLLALLITWSTFACPAFAGQTTQHLTHEGMERMYIVQTPSAGIQTPAPLVIVLHGGGGKAKGVARQAQFSALSETHGAIVMYPDAIDGSWSIPGVPRINGTFQEHDDLSFISRLIDIAVQQYGADPEQVLITGISRGGLLAFYLCQEIPEKITAAAPIIATLPPHFQDSIHKAKGIPIMLLNGTHDPLILYDGGVSAWYPKKILKLFEARSIDPSLLSTDQTIAIFRSLNDCSATPMISQVPDTTHDCCTSESHTYTNADGLEVVLVKTINGGHGMPGQGQYLPKGLIGPVTSDFMAMDLVWPFFQRAWAQ